MNIERLATAFKSSTARKVIFLSPYYIESCQEDKMLRLVKEYAEVVRKACEKHGFDYIDLQEDFDEYLIHRYSASITWDRVHPGYIGSMIIARKILKAIGFEKNLL